MFHEDMPAMFVSYAADILGDTLHGLSGTQIIKITAAHAVDCDAALPHPTYPFSKLGTNRENRSLPELDGIFFEGTLQNHKRNVRTSDHPDPAKGGGSEVKDKTLHQVRPP